MADSVRHVTVKLDATLADWFDANCPFSKQAFAEQCFIMLRVAVETSLIPHPNVHAAKAALMTADNFARTSEAQDGSIPVRPESEET